MVDYLNYHQGTNMSRMHNPPHPGAVLREWLPEGMTVTDTAAALHVTRTFLILFGLTIGMVASLPAHADEVATQTPDKEAPLANPETASERRRAKLWSAKIDPVSGPRELTVANGGFEQIGKPVLGWNVSQHSGPPSYQASQPTSGCAEGNACFRILRTRPQVYGLVHQIVDGRSLVAGQVLTLTAKLRSEAVGPNGWGLIVNFHGRPPGTRTSGLLEQSLSETLTGDSDWREVTLRATIPEGTNQVEFGAMLADEGAGWLDAVSLRVDPK